MNRRQRNILIIVTLIMLLLAGCSAMQTLAPSAQPTTKPLPVEAKTILVGFSIMQIFGHVFWSLFLASVGVVGLNSFNSYREFQLTFQRNIRGGQRSSNEGSSEESPEQASSRTWRRFIPVILLVGILIFALSSLPGIIVTVPPDKIGVLIRVGEEQKA